MTIERTFYYNKHSLIEQLNQSNAFIYYLGLDRDKLFRSIRNNESTASMIHLTDSTDKFKIQEMIDTATRDSQRNFSSTNNIGRYPGTVLCVDATELSNKEISNKFWSEISQTNRRAENRHQRIYVVLLGDLEFLPEDLHQFSTTTN